MTLSNDGIVPARALRAPPTVRNVPAFSLMKATNASSDLAPSYGTASLEPAGKYLMVGYPVTPWSFVTAFESGDSASTLAIMTLSSLAKSKASFSQTGARVLQSKFVRSIHNMLN
jgi:hypothetical protein